MHLTNVRVPPPGEPSSLMLPIGKHLGLIRFRVATPVKERFGRVAGELGTNPSVLLRKFVTLAVAQPEIVERLLSAHLPRPATPHRRP